MVTPFHVATRLEAGTGDVFAANIPDQWQQGRGAFGGLVFGLLVRAACASESDPTRLLRSFSSDISAPVLPGPATARVRVLRRGRNQTNLQAELEQAGEVVAASNMVFSSARPIEAAAEPKLTVPPQALHSFADVPVTPVGPPLGPVFASHYEYRNMGPFPLSGGSEAESAGFVREKPAASPDGRPATLDAPALTALLDTFWPALYPISPRLLAMTTVSFAAQYLQHGTPLPADEPLFFRGRAVVQSEGYCVEFRELWARDKLVAMNQQTFAILR